MTRILARIGRALSLGDPEPHVHFHSSTFWPEPHYEVCYDANCARPRADVAQ
jgi:hypothetical protein